MWQCLFKNDYHMETIVTQYMSKDDAKLMNTKFKES